MILRTDKLTPNVRQLFLEFMTLQTLHRAKSINSETVDMGLAVLGALSEGGVAGLRGDATQAFDMLNAALTACRAAAEPNPFKNCTDEEIATEIIKRIRERRGTQTC